MSLINEDLIRRVFDEMVSRMMMLSMGNFTWLIRIIGKFYQEEGFDWFMPEMGEQMNNKLFGALDFWVPERNEIGHSQVNLTQEQISELEDTDTGLVVL